MGEKIRFILSSVWSFLQPFIRVLLSAVGPVLASAALAAVKTTAENLTGATNREKRDAAYQAIVDDLAGQGLRIGVEVTESMINTALELAVQKLKS